MCPIRGLPNQTCRAFYLRKIIARDFKKHRANRHFDSAKGLLKTRKSLAIIPVPPMDSVAAHPLRIAAPSSTLSTHREIASKGLERGPERHTSIGEWNS